MKKEFAYLNIIVLMFLSASLFYILNRNNRVHEFRTNFIDMCRDYNNSDIPDKKIKNAYLIWYNIPSYNDMLFSFKTLKIENYVDEKIANELKRPYEDNIKNLK